MSLIPFGFWAASGGGGGASSFELLETTTLSTDTASVTFSSLGAYSDYKHLQVRIVSRASASTYLGIETRLNGDTGANYAQHLLYGNGSSVNSEAYSSQTYGAPAQTIGEGESTVAWGAAVIDFLDFSSPSKTTTMRGLSGFATGTNPRVLLNSSLWNNTAAVTSIAFSLGTKDFVAGSRLSLMGIK
tara:strand:- start:5 stop:565 length:561 start_codon:yes stop_codon:yes gene_type:complete